MRERAEKAMRAAGWPVSLFAAAMVFLYRPLFLFSVFSQGANDNDILIYPFKAVFWRALHAGRLPLWEPGNLSGFPFFAEPHSNIFYPVNWALYALPWFYAALNLSVLFDFAIASLGMYLLSRRLGLSKPGSFIAGAAFAYSSSLLGLVTNLAHLHPTAWLPLGLYLTDRLLEEGNLRWMAALAAVICMQLLAGHPQFTFISLVFYALMAVSAAWHAPRGRARLVADFLAAAVLGFAAAAIQLLPTYEFIGQSTRSGFSSAEKLVGSLLPLNVVTALIPNLLRPIGQLQFLAVPYIGVLPLLLAIVAIVLTIRRWRRGDAETMRHARFLLVAAAVGLVLALGKFGLVYVPLSYLPGFSFFRGPGRFILITVTAGALFAGRGFDLVAASLRCRDEAVERSLAFWTRLAAITSGLAVPGIVVGGLLMDRYRGPLSALGRRYVKGKVYGRPPHIYSLQHYYGQVERLLDAARSELTAANPHVWTAVLSISITIAVVLYVLRKRPSPRVWAVAASLLVIGDLALAGYFSGVLAASPTHDYVSSPAAAAVAQKSTLEPTRVYSWPMGALRTGLPEADTPIEKEALRSNRDRFRVLLAMEQVNANLWRGAEHISGDMGLISARNDMMQRYIEERGEASTDEARMDALAGRERLAFLGAMNVEKLILPRELSAGNGLRSGLGGSGKAEYALGVNVLPRAHFSLNVIPASGPEDAMRSMTTGPYSESFRAGAAVIEGAAPARDGTGPMSVRITPEPKVVIVAREPEEVRLKADNTTAGEAWLVLSDSWYPGWRASVDGKAVEIARANLLYRAVRVPAGHHEVVFRYEPRSLRTGAWCSLAAWLIIIGLAAIDICAVRRRIA